MYKIRHLACIIRLLMPNQFVTLEIAARDLCIHIGTMRRWVREGKVPAKKIGRKYLISARVFEDLMAEGGVGHAPLPAAKVAVTGEPEALELLPLWLQFKPSWYRRLYVVAKTCSLTAGETLTHGIELVLKETQAKQK